jgi:hypothetical protein
MTFEQVKSAVLSLAENEKKRLILEVLTEMLPEVCTDEECLDQIRHFVNEETIRTYREQHMGGI